MCGRYTLQQPDSLKKRYNLATLPDHLRPNYNVAPGQLMPIIVNKSGKPTVELMKWGLVPVWAKDIKIGYKLINARGETVFEKPMWRNVILQKRCLVPADGFFEWQRGSNPKDKKKPFFIHPKQAGLFSFAGMWEAWKDAEGLEWKTYTIITTEPNREMSAIHDRMPVILTKKDEAAWLDEANNSQGKVAVLIRPMADGNLDMYVVSDEVNSPRNNSPELLQPVT